MPPVSRLEYTPTNLRYLAEERGLPLWRHFEMLLANPVRADNHQGFRQIVGSTESN